MNINFLAKLLEEPESATLEFKRDFYQIYTGNEQTKQRGEFAKDILSLANGSFDSVGKPAYLIFGIEDSEESSGDPRIVGVDGKLPSADDILKLCRGLCDPALQSIDTDLIEIKGKKIFVVTVFATPYVHETTRELQTPKTTYPPHMVFIRRNSSIDNASTKERQALELLKKLSIDERKKTPSLLTGTIAGAAVVGLIVSKNADKLFGKDFPSKVAIGSGIVAGAIMGGSIAFTIESLFLESFRLRQFIARRSIKQK